jgi:BirA family transcriptional regulator, biotin operon repressor / biotin---[acetyl-CoA-carboxylase] ligase
VAAAELLEALASGRFVSGQELADRVGISRAAVWKQVRTLRGRGFLIDAVRGRGYRIHGGTPLLDHEAITDLLLLPVRQRVTEVELLREVDSTNARLLARPALPGPVVCIAELQSSGRGRRGRDWHAPFGASLCLSLAWPFSQLPKGFGGIGLVCGVAVSNALAQLGFDTVRLKWPNDLMHGGAKLGGLLVESRGEAGGQTRVVVGLGVNWRIPPGTMDERIDQPWTDLASLPGPLPDRSTLAATLINALVMALDEFSERGFGPFRARWQELDMLYGEEVTIEVEGQRVQGRAVGIDEDGALRVVEAGAAERRFTAGEVSVRPRP